MNIRYVEAKRILTRQKRGFLTEGTYPFTHTLSWAVGCGFGNIYCGKYCYAQKFPNWLYNREDNEDWGDAVIVKENAPQLLHRELSKAQSRSNMRIFMSSVTDPYQPIERKIRMTRRCLEVFAEYDDLDLLVIQTRSPFVIDDLRLIKTIPYAAISMTLETNRADLPYGPNQAFIHGRYKAIQQAAEEGIATQITVSPCLPYEAGFADWLADSGVDRIVVDTFVDGDGSDGTRTAETPFANEADYDWRDDDPATRLHDDLKSKGVDVGWSVDGFGGIPFRTEHQM